MKKLFPVILFLLALVSPGAFASGASSGGELPGPSEMKGSWTRKITETKDWYNWTFHLTFIYGDGQAFAQKGKGVVNISTGGKDYRVTFDYSAAGAYAVEGDILTINLDPSRTVIEGSQEGLPEFVCGILGTVEKQYRKSLAKPVRFRIESVGKDRIVLVNGKKERCIFNRDR